MDEKLLRIINIVLRNANRPSVSQLNDGLQLNGDLGLDSLNLAELSVRIEEEFGVDVYDNKIVLTIGDIKNALHGN